MAKRYFKDNKLVLKPNLIRINNEIIINPNDKILKENGYIIVESERNNLDVDSDRIKKYKKITDNLFITYLIYKELGDIEKAESIKKEWINKRNEIKNKYPYIKGKMIP